MKIKLYNKIAPCGLKEFPADFEIGEEVTGENGIVVRSADLTQNPFPPTLRAIARAGAGVNNIPVAKCTEQGICVFNTPGANADAVKELCIAGLFLTSRKVSEGIEWAKTLAGRDDALQAVEKEKKRFVGPEIGGKVLGVVGMGAIGKKVALAAAGLGMRVVGYDPFLPADAVIGAGVEVTDDLTRVWRESDYVTVHVPSLPTTRGILCRAAFDQMKDGVRVLNLARADLAVEEDILQGLASGKIAAYFTDFPTGKLAGKDGVIATPHLGASTPEAEDNCAVMACRQMREYLLWGNIQNSVNFPSLTLEHTEPYRIGILALSEEATQRAVQELLGTARFAKNTKGDVTYYLCESKDLFDLDKIKSVGGVLRVTSY